MFKKKRPHEGERPHHQPTLPPPPQTTKSHHAHHPIPPRRELLFHTQLAHGSSTKDIKDFSNVKELYNKIGEAFNFDPSEIMFCTLNTPKIDMSRLLGGQIGLDDFIFTHVKGITKTATLTKQEASLGLTITDNGAGVAFIKRIKEGSVSSRVPEVAVGDMVVSIDGQNLVGRRHYEVARLLKDLPRYQSFTLTVIEPKKAFAVAPRAGGHSSRPVSRLLEDSSPLEADSSDRVKPSLRLKSDGQAILEEAMTSWTLQATERVDDLLESFMGIRDNQLARVIVELARSKTTVDDFAAGIDGSQLAHFEFPDSFILDLWVAIDPAHSARV